MCIFCTREHLTIWASETLLPHPTLDVIHHYKAGNISSWTVLVKYTFCFTLCPCYTNFSTQTISFSASAGFKIPQWPGHGNLSKCEDRKELISKFPDHCNFWNFCSWSIFNFWYIYQAYVLIVDITGCWRTLIQEYITKFTVDSCLFLE
jgi:hypothetical protein